MQKLRSYHKKNPAYKKNVLTHRYAYVISTARIQAIMIRITTAIGQNCDTLYVASAGMKKVALGLVKWQNK